MTLFNTLLVAILTPEALFLTARGGFAGIEALFVSLGLLDGAYQFGLFHPSGPDVVLFRYFPDLVQFHAVFSLRMRNHFPYDASIAQIGKISTTIALRFVNK
jgi:hypothetical protein